jgi:REP element-mobilizing transposase RayT
LSRIARQDTKTTYFHVMVQGLNKEYIFGSNEDKAEYIKRIEKQKIEEVKIYSYCIMSNHAHFLIHSKKTADLSLMMKRINTSYASYYNRNTKRAGYVFRNRFRLQEIYDEKYLISCMVYIHYNPVKANLVKNLKDYDYGSYNEYLKNEGKITDINGFYNLTGLTAKDILELHNKDYEEQWMDEKLTKTYNEACIEFIKEHNLSEIAEIITNRKLLKLFTEKISRETAMSLRMIAEVLGVNRETLRKIFMSNYTSP